MTDERFEPTGDDIETGDPTSTTGATGTERGEHVGRVSGADPGYAGETGAERRAETEDAGEPDPH
jgi:hypothetical protein